MPGRRYSGTGLADRSGKKRPAARPLSPERETGPEKLPRRFLLHRPGLGTRFVPPGPHTRHCPAHPLPGAQAADQHKAPALERTFCLDADFRSKAPFCPDTPVRFVRLARTDPWREAGASDSFHPDGPKEVQAEPVALPPQGFPAGRIPAEFAALLSAVAKSRPAQLHKAGRIQADRTDRTVLPEAGKAARAFGAGAGSPSARFDRFAPCGSLPFTCRKDGIISVDTTKPAAFARHPGPRTSFLYQGSLSPFFLSIRPICSQERLSVSDMYVSCASRSASSLSSRWRNSVTIMAERTLSSPLL